MTRPYMSADDRRKQALSFITAGGISSKDLCKAMGYSKSENAVRIVDALVFAGMVHSCRTRATDNPTTRSWVTMYFDTVQARDAFVLARAAQSAARKKERKSATAALMPYYAKRNAKRKEQRALRAKERGDKLAADKAQRDAMRLAEAEQRKERQRLDREAKAVARDREKAEANKQRLRLKVETAEAGQLVFKKGTAVVRPKKLSFADMPASNPNGVKPEVIESKLRDRFAPDKAPRVISSNDCRAWAKAAA